MQFKYMATSNAATYTTSQDSITTVGAPLGITNQDVFIKKIIIGAPVASGNIVVYNKTAVVAAQTDNIALKITLPGTLTQGSATFNYPTVYDFTSTNGKGGLQVNGGVVTIDQSMQVTVIWVPVSEEVEG